MRSELLREDIGRRLTSPRLALVSIGVVGALVALWVVPSMIEEVMPDQITVIQAPISGKLAFYTTPGWAMQNMGTVTSYYKRNTVNFKKDQNGAGGIPIRFSDGGHAVMYGSVQFAMPTDDKNLLAIHSAYRGNQAVVENLLKTVLNKSVYLTGTLMTSKESYAEKRNDLIHYVSDQMQNGVYKTRSTTKWVKDEITGQSKEITQAEILVDKSGNIERQEDSVLNQFKITSYNFTIEDMPYDAVIEQQIKQQQQITMDVQTSMAQAKKKDQDAITAEAEGRRSIAEARAKAETEKTTAVVAAQRAKEVAITEALKEKEVQETAAKRDLAVAQYAKQTADEYRAKLILEGQGESEKRKLILAADGALAQKLDAYVKVNTIWAGALAQYRGDVTPKYVSGATGGTGTNGFQQFMEAQSMKAVRDLNLDVTIGAGVQKADSR